MNVYTRLPVTAGGGVAGFTKLLHEKVLVRSDCLPPLLAAGFDRYERFEAPRAPVETVAESRSSRTRRLDLVGIGEVYLKLYSYKSWKSRWRGALRNTGPRRSRACREWRSLEFLAARGIGCVQPVAVGEARVLGFVRSCILMTRAADGFRPIDALLPTAGASGSARRLSADLAGYVRRLHEAGFLDGNLRTRNLLARETAGEFEILSLDSPKGKRARVLRSQRQDRDLASLDRDLRGDLSASERLRTYLTYRGVRSARGEKRRIRRILRLADRFARSESDSRSESRGAPSET